MFHPITGQVIHEATAISGSIAVARPGTCLVRMRKPVRFKGQWCVRINGRTPLRSYQRLNIGFGDVLIFHWDMEPTA